LESMNDKQLPNAADDQEVPGTGPSVSRIGRRSDSRVLTFASAAAVVFLAVAIAKPWGTDTPQPLPSGSRSSLAVAVPQPATATESPDGSPTAIPWPATAPSPDALETPQSVVFYMWSDQGPVSEIGCGDGFYTLTLPAAPASPDAATGPESIEVTVVCASGTPGEFHLVLPEPSSP
jgi:hypothetical protein